MASPGRSGPTGSSGGRLSRLRLPSSALTARGWGLAGSVVAMLIAGYVFGILELFALSAAAVVVLAVCLMWTHFARWDVTVDRQLHGLRAGVGDDVIVNLRLTNRSRHDSPTLRLRDPVELSDGAVDLAMASLPPGASVRGSYRVRAGARGVYKVGPLSMYSTDPFGLTQRLRVAPGASTVIVHPKVEPLHVSTGAAGLDQRPVGALPAPGRDNDEFSALREYHPGDDIRRLHWSSTAKTGMLMVREDQIQHRGQLTVLVDLQASTWTGHTLEWGLSAAASVALASLEAGLSVRLVTTAGADSGASAGGNHGARILDELAAAEVHAGKPFAAGPAAAGARRSGHHAEAGGSSAKRFERHDAVDGTDTLVVVGGEGTAGALKARSGITRSASVIQLIIEGTGSHPEGMHGTTARVIRVGADGLAAAWNRVSP
jgi:uncharacterized protein (DUF58 family)